MVQSQNAVEKTFVAIIAYTAEAQRNTPELRDISRESGW